MRDSFDIGGDGAIGGPGGPALDPVFPLHHGGKIEIRPTVRIRDNQGLSLVYTPGVAKVSQAIAANEDLAYDYTWKSNTVLVATDGTAVLGLGNIGPKAALPPVTASVPCCCWENAWMSIRSCP